MFGHGVMLTKNKGYQKKKMVCLNLLSKMRLSLLKRLTIVKIAIAALALCGFVAHTGKLLAALGVPGCN